VMRMPPSGTWQSKAFWASLGALIIATQCFVQFVILE
jgi:hypothetical protein